MPQTPKKKPKKTPKRSKGAKVYLVGAGPGDPELITVKGLKAIGRADCVIYDFLASERLLSHAKKGAETIYVGKKGCYRHISQSKITRLIIKKALGGKVVTRLKGGDPFIFGRGGEEALELRRASIPFEVVPGVTSAIAAPAYAGIPLTHREHASTVTFITGHEDPLKKRSAVSWKKLSIGDGTLVILMGWKNLSVIVKKLIENGRDPKTPVAMVRWGTMPGQKTVVGTLEDIVARAKEAGMMPPVVTIVGDVVSLRKRLSWFDTRPLFGKRIVVTRTAEQAGTFTRTLEDRGAVCLSLPVIKIVKPKSYAPLDRAIKRLATYDWAIFTSVNGVEYFFERLYKLGLDLRELKGVKVAAIGPATEKAITGRGIKVDLTPKEFKAEGVLKALTPRRIKGKRFLLPRAEKAREILPHEIRRLGGTIDVAPAYRTIRPRGVGAELKNALKKGALDAVTFTSSSTVTNFAGLFKKHELAGLLKGVTVACIGPITAKTARENGLTVDLMPKRYTIPALTEALEEFFNKKKGSQR